MTVQACDADTVRQREEGGGISLKAGDLIYLAGNVRHEVKAVTDASVLLTILLMDGGE